MAKPPIAYKRGMLARGTASEYDTRLVGGRWSPSKAVEFTQPTKIRRAHMGQFHFDVPSAAGDLLDGSLWSDAYICGIEGVPWHSHCQFDGARLTINRNIDSSGKLYLACPLEGLGYRTLSTCSLRPLSESPYSLLLELARGSCYRARTQSDAWQRAGLILSEEFRQLLDEGTNRFLDAAQHRDDPDQTSREAADAIRLLERGLTELGECYAAQSIAFRKDQDQPIGTLLGGTVVPPSPTGTPLSESFCEAFNTASVRLSWAEIETDSGQYDYEAADRSIQFCASKGLRIIGGPLVDFREKLLPHWMYLMEDDFETLLSSVTQFVERTVAKFRGSVQLWNCATGLNTPGPLKLDDEKVMRLSVGILQTVRRTDPNTPAIMSFDQPFGEYLAKHRDSISPLHFADALVRSGLGMAGIGLEFRVGYSKDCTLPRSSVDFGQMIDRWATLGLPMLVQLAVPGARGDDAQSMTAGEALASPNGLDLVNEQLRVAGPMIRTLLAKHIVHGIVWDGWCDAERHVMPHSGLIDGHQKPRAIYEYVKRLRTEFLM
ncbi:MAG: endo-1,4-beta-xylanase [Planctomycetota bacterium]